MMLNNLYVGFVELVSFSSLIDFVDNNLLIFISLTIISILSLPVFFGSFKQEAKGII